MSCARTGCPRRPLTFLPQFTCFTGTKVQLLTGEEVRAQWLPAPFTTFDALQRYLMAQWVPCIIALALYCFFQDHMLHVSLMEVCSLD